MKVEIDRRPIWVIVLLKSYRFLFFSAVGLLFFYLINLPTPDGLTVQGQRAISLFAVCLILWVTGMLPLAITSLLAIVTVPLLGILDKKETYALFGNEAVFFILGAFILAAAVMHSGLSGRIALIIMNKFGKTPTGLILSIFLLGAVLSFFMSEHAVAAMLFPIVLEIAKGLNLRPGSSSYGKMLFLALAWGCVIGGIATFLGGARVPLAVGILKEATGQSISFFEYTLAVFPIVVILLIVSCMGIIKFLPKDIGNIEQTKLILAAKIKAIGRIGYAEYMVAIVMGTTVFFWIFFSRHLGIANIAIVAVVGLFLLRLVRWKDVEEYVNWGIILMYGGAITLGASLEKTGAALWMANTAMGDWITHPLLLIALVSLLTLLLTEGMSNAAVIAVLMPVGIGLAGKMGLEPKLVTFAIAVPAGLAFCFPMATPANAIAVSSGYINVRDMAKLGVIMGAISWIVFILVAKFYWPVIGLRF